MNPKVPTQLPEGGPRLSIGASIKQLEVDEWDLADLPFEALLEGFEPIEINNTWLAHAPHEHQLAAMKGWWYSRYEDPSSSTPYDSGEGGFIYVHGGPFDPADLLRDRFSYVVDASLIDILVTHLHHEVGDKWAPIPNFDFEFDVADVEQRHEPSRHLLNSIETDSGQLLALGQSHRQSSKLLRRHAFIALVAALETYLWETTKYWVSHDPSVVKRLVTNSHYFKDRKISLKEIFAEYENLTATVKVFLREVVWHRLDKVKPFIECALSTKLPSVEPLLELIVVRHDLVHRNGRTTDGHYAIVTQNDFYKLQSLVLQFCIAIERAVVAAWPSDDADLGLLSLAQCLEQLGEFKDVASSEAIPDF